MASRVELVNFIRFQLDEALPTDNAHHEFEAMCRAVARARIARNLLPASGPVSAGGDGGLDFETFKSYLDEESEPTCAFLAHTSGDYLAFACTIQSEAVEGKIASDVKRIMGSEPDVDRVYAMCTAIIPVGHRRKLKRAVKKAHGVPLEVLDGNALAELLADADLFDVARDHLKVPEHMRPPPPVAVSSGPGYSELPADRGDVRYWTGPSGRRRYQEMQLGFVDSEGNPDSVQLVEDIVAERRQLAADGFEAEAAATLWEMASKLVESGLHQVAIELLDDLDGIVPPGQMNPVEDAWRVNVRALALAGLGQRDQADVLWRQMLAMGERLDDKGLQATALQNLATSDANRGDFTAAKDTIAQSLKLMRELDHVRAIAQLLGNLVLVLTDEGDFSAATALSDTHLETVRMARDVALLTSAHGNRGRLLVRQGELNAAEVEFKAALRFAKRSGDPVKVILSLQNLGAVCVDQGRLGDAMRWYRKGIRGAELYDLDVHVEVLERSLATALDRAGRRRDAVAAFDAARRAAKRIGDTHLWAQSTMNIGAEQILNKKPASAVEPLTQAISAFRQLGEYEWEANARRNLAAAFVALGRIRDAVAEARLAADLYPDSAHETCAELLTYAAQTALAHPEMLTDAIELFDLSLAEVAAFAPPSDLAVRAVNAADALAQHGADEPALALYDRAVETIENQPEERETLMAVLNDRAVALGRLRRHEEARVDLRRCIALADGTDDPNARNALANLVEVQRQLGEVADAVSLGRQAVRQAQLAGDDEALAHAVNNLWPALLDDDTPDIAKEAGQELADVAAAAASREWAARADVVLGRAAYLKDDFETATRRFRHARDLYHEERSEDEMLAVQHWLESTTRTGDLAELDAITQQLADLVAPASAGQYVPSAITRLGRSALHLLDARHLNEAVPLLTLGVLMGVHDFNRRDKSDDHALDAAFSALCWAALAGRDGPYPPDEVYDAFNARLDDHQPGLAKAVAPLFEQAKHVESGPGNSGPAVGT